MASLADPLGTRTSYDLAGKVVLITGGNGGIGSATARTLLERALASSLPTSTRRRRSAPASSIRQRLSGASPTSATAPRSTRPSPRPSTGSAASTS